MIHSMTRYGADIRPGSWRPLQRQSECSTDDTCHDDSEVLLKVQVQLKLEFELFPLRTTAMLPLTLLKLKL